MNERIPDRSQRVRTYLDDLVARNRTPGIQYLVVDSNGAIFEYAAGLADIGHRVPMKPSTSLMAYSMSKPITAAAVLQLIENGKVRLDDPVDRYVESSPYGPAITVRQLVAHTSGIPNPLPLRWVHLATVHDAFDESSALNGELKRHPDLAFTPGAKYRYSNIGYWLLAQVVERASGQSFTSYVQDYVFQPVGAAPSELSYRIADASQHATGYLEKFSFVNMVKGFLIDDALIGEYDGRWLQIRSHYTNGPAFGGVIGNAHGFGKFLQDQLRQQSALFGVSTRALFFTPQQTTSGAPVAMTLGWHIGSLDRERYFYKEGGGGGFHAMMRIYPDAGIATVVMSNATGFDVKECLNTVDRQFLH